MQYYNVEKMKIYGTVKIHGTNAAVALNCSTGEMYTQSRNRLISIEDDNAGFAQYVYTNRDFYRDALEEAKKRVPDAVTILIYGEWAGGNIQKGVAITGVEKFFAPFEVKCVKEDGSYVFCNDVIELNDEVRCFPVWNFKTFEVEIDVNNPGITQQEIVEMTLAVEEKCPVGEFFGIVGTGEGIVFTDETCYHKFKSKGEKHSVSKVKTLATVDVEKVKAVEEFVKYAVTENHLEQGIQYMNEMHIPVDTKHTSDFIKWVTSDVYKEELDTVVENCLEWKVVAKSVANKARQWFMTKL